MGEGEGTRTGPPGDATAPDEQGIARQPQDLRASGVLTTWMSWEMVRASSSCGRVGEKPRSRATPLPLPAAGGDLRLCDNVPSAQKRAWECLNFTKGETLNFYGLVPVHMPLRFV